MFLPGSLLYKVSKELHFAYDVSGILSQTVHEPQLRHSSPVSWLRQQKPIVQVLIIWGKTHSGST